MRLMAPVLRHLLLRLVLVGLVGLQPACALPRSVEGPPSGRGDFHLFLLAGQSNMAGRGKVEEQDRAPHPRVWMLDRDNQWVPAVEPMHFDKPIAGVGPGRSFGIALANAEPTIRVGLIPTAVGGSPIASWEPGATHQQTGAHPYDDALARARIAMRDGELKAVLWQQGESDSNEKSAPEYARNLEALARRFRKDLGNPELPFLIGQLGHFEGRPWDQWRAQVDRAHRSQSDRLPHVAFVSADGLKDRGDKTHFSAAAARELGRRYAEAYLAAYGKDASVVARRAP